MEPGVLVATTDDQLKLQLPVVSHFQFFVTNGVNMAVVQVKGRIGVYPTQKDMSKYAEMARDTAIKERGLGWRLANPREFASAMMVEATGEYGLTPTLPGEYAEPYAHDLPYIAARDGVGKWLSAALDDPKVCDEMKADINRWLEAAHERK